MLVLTNKDQKLSTMGKELGPLAKHQKEVDGQKKLVIWMLYLSMKLSDLLYFDMTRVSTCLIFKCCNQDRLYFIQSLYRWIYMIIFLDQCIQPTIEYTSLVMIFMLWMHIINACSNLFWCEIESKPSKSKFVYVI